MSHVLGTLNIMSILAMAPVIQRDLDLSVAQFGLLMTAYNGTQALVVLGVGNIIDRLGVGWSLFLAHVLLVASTILFSQATDLTVAMAATSLMGFGYSFTNPATAKGVLQWFPREYRATAMSTKQTGVPFGGILAASNGVLVTILSWQSILWLIAVTTLVGAGLCLLIVERPKRRAASRSRRSSAGFMLVLRNWNLTSITLVGAIYNIGQANLYAYTTLFMREAVQASQPVAGLCLGLVHAASATARIGWGVISDRWFPWNRKRLFLVIGCAGTVFLLAMSGIGPGPWGILFGGVLAVMLGLTIAAYAGLVQTMAVETVELRETGTAMGYHMAVTSLCGAIGPPLFGAVVDATSDFGNGWLITAACAAVATLILAFGFKERTRPADV